ncbi:Uncharacterized protein AC499_3244 [Pseudomonas amygdali pv. lachrymans]|uniref:Uncharacterized protein n=1 Tax=Pseudomonas amygdali pv. lachrymans TaxID=53707 RepID=A0ABR5KTS8_PSEAV|nr:Uncharacterized protein AC499_3244 [Pseudomonas amygdali pv. lachrymans]
MLSGRHAGPQGRIDAVADSVRRLCPLAAQLAGNGRAGTPACVLEATAGRATADSGTAHRSTAPGAAQLRRSAIECRAGCRAAERPQDSGAAAGHHPVHAVAGVFTDLVAPLQRSGRYTRRRARRQPHSQRNPGADRFLRQHPGAQGRLRHANHRGRVAATDQADCCRGPSPSRPAVRTTGRSPATAARLEPQPTVSGGLQPPERRPQRGPRTGRSAPGISGVRQTHGAVRPDPGHLRTPERPGRFVDLRHRPVRRRNHRAHGRALAQPAEWHVPRRQPAYR